MATGYAKDDGNAIFGKACALGNLKDAGAMLVLLLKLGDILKDFVLVAQFVQWYAYHAALFGYGLHDGLPNPPYGIGDELEPSRLVESLGGFHQAHVALADEVHEVHALGGVLLGDRNYKAQVAVYHLVARSEIAFVDSLCQFNLSVKSKQRVAVYFA